jgi:uncharacterized phage-associated protein
MKLLSIKVYNIFDNAAITHLSLQKIIYYCYGMCVWSTEFIPFLPIDKNNNIINLSFWKLGPVFEPIYQELKVFGSKQLNPDDILLKDISYDAEDRISFEDYKIIDNETKHYLSGPIGNTLLYLRGKTSSELVNMTHTEDSAWFKIYNNNKTIEENAKNYKILKNQDILENIMLEIAHYNYFNSL